MNRIRRVGWPLRRVTWAPRYGIAQRHWAVFRRYAGAEVVYLLLGEADERAIPWIDRGFPTRDRQLGTLRIDPELGLLVARDEAEKRLVFANGHYVLAPVVSATGQSPSGVCVALNPRQPPLRVTFRESWVRPGIVIDRRTQRPFTSGYELAAAIGAGDALGYASTLGTLGSPASAAPSGVPRESRTRFIDEVRRGLNALVGDERVAVGSPPSGRRKGQGTPSETQPVERLLIFCPDGTVSALEMAPGLWAQLQVRDLLRALHPDRTDVSGPGPVEG